MAKIVNTLNIPAWRKSLDILRYQVGRAIEALNDVEAGTSAEVQKMIDDGDLVTTDVNLVDNISDIEWDDVEAVKLKQAADLSTQIFQSANIEPIPVGPED